jgi:hypothetical protein
VPLSDARTVAREVSAIFQAVRHPASRRADGPAWLDAPAADRRSLVWQAMGVVNAGLEVSSADALALLRAHAYSLGRDLDDLASAVLNRELPLEQLALDEDIIR